MGSFGIAANLQATIKKSFTLMKILSLKSENVKRIIAVEITPKGNTVIIAGENEQGKSSVLDSILYALAGKDALPQLPVREGQDKARIELDLGEYKVTRTITAAGGGTLTVRNRDGVPITSPQTLLDKLYGKLTFDPLEFKSQKPPQRVETLRALLGLDFTDIDTEYAKTFAERTVVNRQVSDLTARIKAMPEYPNRTPISIDEILTKQKQAIDHNESNRKARIETDQAFFEVTQAAKLIDGVFQEIATLEARLDQLRRSISSLRNDYDSATENHKMLRNYSEKLQDIDVDQFSELLRTAQSENEKVRANEERNKVRQELDTKQKEAFAFSDRLGRLEAEKKHRLMNAEWPIDGLMLHAGKEVRFNDIPFEQCSTAQQIKISVAMGIAMNPELRILLVRQGNDLDLKNLQLISDIADKYDVQIWLEKVMEHGECCVVIEDGHVKNVSPPKRQEILQT